MKSPITNKEMSLNIEDKKLTFRKEEFQINYSFYFCEDSGEKFTTTDLDEVNISQLYNQYREKYNIPFIHEIKNLLSKYNVSASKMSEILNLGPNTYSKYENGIIPNKSNGQLIQLIKDSKQFKACVEMSNNLLGDEKEILVNNVDLLISKEKRNKSSIIEKYLLGTNLPNKYSGFRIPDFEKLTQMVVFFAQELEPWKTKLNKLLFYADFEAYRKTGYSMSGVTYCAINKGPVPDNYQGIYAYMHKAGFINVLELFFLDKGYGGTKFKVIEGLNFNSDLFNSVELDLLKYVSDRFRDTTTNEIIEISHKERAWTENIESKGAIDYNYAFYLSEN